MLPKVNSKFVAYDKFIDNEQIEVRNIMEYYERIKGLREDRDIKQIEIAKLLGTDQSYYSKYERGIHPMTAIQIKKLAEFFNVTADYILGISDNPKPLK